MENVKKITQEKLDDIDNQLNDLSYKMTKAKKDLEQAQYYYNIIKGDIDKLESDRTYYSDVLDSLK
jgi:peptidoglycan hydrolase CwlO-like protein